MTGYPTKGEAVVVEYIYSVCLWCVVCRRCRCRVKLAWRWKASTACPCLSDSLSLSACRSVLAGGLLCYSARSLSGVYYKSIACLSTQYSHGMPCTYFIPYSLHLSSFMLLPLRQPQQHAALAIEKVECIMERRVSLLMTTIARAWSMNPHHP